MELLQLRYFCDAARSENFSKTAKRFSVPPSDISQSIRRLEDELGVSLFNRSANRVSINEKGLFFLEKASLALRLLDEGATSLSDDGKSGEILLCVETNRRIVMEAVEKFSKEFPEVKFKTHFFFEPTKEDFDLIIAADSALLPHYEENHLITEPVALAISAEHPMAENFHSLSDFSSATFITANEQSNLYRMTFDICRDAGFTPRIAVQSDDPFYIRKCVELGLGVALVPAISWRGQFSSRIRLKTLPGYTRTTCLYLNKKRHLPLCVKEFAKLLTQICSKEEEL